MNGDTEEKVSFPIKLKLLVFVIGIIVIIVTVFSIVGYVSCRSIVRDRILNDINALADSKAGQVTRLIEQDFERTALVASRTKLRECLRDLQEGRGEKQLLKDKMTKILNDACASVKAIKRIDVCDMQGTVAASTLSENAGRELAETRLFAEGLKGFCLGEILLGKNDRPMYEISAPLYDPSGQQDRTIGIAVTCIEITRILGVLHNYTGLGETGEVMLCRKTNGEMLVLNSLRHRPGSSLKLRLSRETGHGSAYLVSGPVSAGKDYRGVDTLFVNKPVPAAGWGLTVKIDQDEAFAPVDRLAMEILIISVLILLVSIPAVIIFARFITFPLERLHEQSLEISSGNLDSQADIATRDEIGRLGATFNHMAASLRSQMTRIREEERKYGTLVSNLPGMNYRCRHDADWTMEFVSSGCGDLTGYDPEDIIDNKELSYNDIIHPDDRGDVWDTVQQGIKNKEPFQMEYRITTASGHEKWVWEQGTGVYSEEGELIALEGYVVDMTDRKHAEQNMQHLNRILRAIRNVNQLITRERNRDRLIQEACDKLIETSGYGFAWIALFDEFRSFIKAVHAGLGDEFKELRTRLRKGPVPACCEHAFNTQEIITVTEEIRAECAECPLRATCTDMTQLAVRLEYSGNIYGVLSVSLPMGFSDREEELSLFSEVVGDIAFALYTIEQEEQHGTVRKALKVEEQRYRDLVENVNDLVQSVAPDGKIIFANHAWKEALGYTDRDIAGMNIFEVIHEDEQEHCKDVFGSIMSGERTDDVETKFVSKNGEVIDVKGTATCSFVKGKPVSTYGIFRNVTESKQAAQEKERLQQQLLQSQKMEAIGNLAGGVAHDFNNILTVIKGNTELGLMNLDKENPLFPDMMQVKEAADRAANLTRQLLLYGRRQPMDFTHLDMNETIRNLLKMLKRLIGEDIEIQTDLDEPVWPVKADAGNIEQVIMNISVNARDAMPDGGTLTYSTKNTKVDDAYVGMYTYARTGRFVCLSVEDTGTGMDKETREHIFEPFFTTKGVSEGTGLGMSVVYGIIKEHEGWVNLYSEPGKGTTFKVYLPASFTREKPKPITKDIEKHARGKGEKILLVEDEETVLVTTRKILEEMGYDITVAATAKEAAEIFDREKGSFDLLFTDTILPDVNGIELIDQLTEKKPDLKVLLSSGYAGEKVQRDIIQERKYPFVQKPYDMTELLALINQILKGESQT